MEYSIFNNTKRIRIDDELIKDYESSVVPFTAKTPEYLAVTSRMDENSSDEDILKGIIEGINEEIYLYRNKNLIIKEARDKGLIP